VSWSSALKLKGDESTLRWLEIDLSAELDSAFVSPTVVRRVARQQQNKASYIGTGMLMRTSNDLLAFDKPAGRNRKTVLAEGPDFDAESQLLEDGPKPSNRPWFALKTCDQNTSRSQEVYDSIQRGFQGTDRT
jgi:hypothetical protein